MCKIVSERWHVTTTSYVGTVGFRYVTTLPRRGVVGKQMVTGSPGVISPMTFVTS